MDFLSAIKLMVPSGGDMYRLNNPNLVYSFDGAEGIEFWKMDEEKDELTEHKFNIEHYFANDWVVV